MKHLGFPLIGDYLYNPDMEHISRQALHSYRLRFSHPITQEKVDFVAPLPEDMQRVLNVRNCVMYGTISDTERFEHISYSSL